MFERDGVHDLAYWPSGALVVIAKWPDPQYGRQRCGVALGRSVGAAVALPVAGLRRAQSLGHG